MLTHHRRKRNLIRPVLIRSAALIPLIAVPLHATALVQRPESSCDAEAFMASRRPKVEIYPEKVIVEPWQGQHQVYGIFMIPDSVRWGEPVLLKVKDVGVYCDAAMNNGTQLQGISAKPNHHLMIDYIRTRTGLALIAQGKLNQLQQRSNWSLVYHR